MPSLLQINTVINSGSTGRIAEDIGRIAIANGWESYIAFGRNPRPSASHAIRIGNRLDVLLHVLATRLLDLHGLASRRATRRLVRQIERIRPDVIHLHNIHGYYLNYKILFRYLAASGTPVVWTMHDCWAATGHCPHYTFVQCIVWQSERGCRRCPQKKSYPKSVLFSNAAHNFRCKRRYFNLLPESQLTIVTPSRWLSDEIGKSYLGHYRRTVINNGIDLEVFRPSEPTSLKAAGQKDFVILGVANVWSERKGLADFITLASLLAEDERIVLIGLSDTQRGNLPEKITAVPKTDSIQQLAAYYSAADVYFNASVEEIFGMTCVEAQACGTPVVAYDSTAVPETFCEKTGILVSKNDVSAVYDAIQKIKGLGKAFYSEKCVEWVKEHFSESDRIRDIVNLYTPPHQQYSCAKKTILGVASVWNKRKGLADFIKLADLLREDEEIVLVGLSENQMLALPKDKRIWGIRRTESQEELAALYSASLCFVNPTYEDTFPTTNIEAFACGTPVITYRTCGSPEIIDEKTGFVVETGDIAATLACIRKIEDAGKSAYQEHCVARARELYDKGRNFLEYMEIYEECVVKKGANMSTNNRMYTGGGINIE